MEEIEVGEYVRTDKGYIAQIKEFKKNYTVGRRINKKEEVDENYINLGRNQCKFVESIDYSIPPCYPTDEELERIKKHIVKHSKNITDLIEEDDYVNGSKVVGKDNNCILILTDGGQTCYRNIFENKDIKSIVTKERFNSIAYRLEE